MRFTVPLLLLFVACRRWDRRSTPAPPVGVRPTPSLMAIDLAARPASASAARAAPKALAPKRRSRAPFAVAAALLVAAASTTWEVMQPEPATLVTIPADPLEAAVKRST